MAIKDSLLKIKDYIVKSKKEKNTYLGILKNLTTLLESKGVTTTEIEQLQTSVGDEKVDVPWTISPINLGKELNFDTWNAFPMPNDENITLTVSKRIRTHAFDEMPNVKSISSESVTSLAKYSINGMSKLESINFPNVSILGEYAINNSNMTEAIFPSVTSLQNMPCINNCNNLTRIAFDNAKDKPSNNPIFYVCKKVQVLSLKSLQKVSNLYSATCQVSCIVLRDATLVDISTINRICPCIMVFDKVSSVPKFSNVVNTDTALLAIVVHKDDLDAFKAEPTLSSIINRIIAYPTSIDDLPDGLFNGQDKQKYYDAFKQAKVGD